MALPPTMSGVESTEVSPSDLAAEGYWNLPSLHASRRCMVLPASTSPSMPLLATSTGPLRMYPSERP